MAEEKKVLSLIDLENMQDEMELEGFNPEADANAILPPIPAGKYLLNVKHLENEDGVWEEKESQKKGTKYLNTTLVVTVVENPFNPKETWGRSFRVNNCMTMVMENTGTSGVQAVLQGLGKQAELVNGPQTATRHAVLLSKALISEPLVGAEVEWEASFYDKEAEKDVAPRLRRMKSFPSDGKGGFLTVAKATVDGVGYEADARNYVRRWIKVAELTAPKEEEKAAAPEAPKAGPKPAPRPSTSAQRKSA